MIVGDDAGRTRVKICGLTRPEDALRAAELGADALGVVFAPSPRQVDIARAVEVLALTPVDVERVGVFVDQPLEFMIEAAEACRLGWIQLHGREPEEIAEAIPVKVIRAVHLRGAGDLEKVEGYPADAFLLDAPPRDGRRGGTGRKFDWGEAGVLPWPRRRVIVAGGLDARNVGAVIEVLRPGGVDVASGVESRLGVKDELKIEAFVGAVRAADDLIAGAGRGRWRGDDDGEENREWER
jgi:phosphoribosylanthranilate isomerase